MTAAIMQPYFFPYLGYFSLIKESDLFILFDTPQYIRHGWINRNQILNNHGKPFYIMVPLMKMKRETPINQMIIRNNENWQQKLFEQLKVYKNKAPFYHQVTEMLQNVFGKTTDSIVTLNYNAIKEVCSYLDITTPIKIFSEMELDIQDVHAADEWALNICEAIGATNYINPIGGLDFFDQKKYSERGIDIKFLKHLPVEYSQFENEFIPHLSILDVLMFNDPNKIQDLLGDFKYFIPDKI